MTVQNSSEQLTSSSDVRRTLENVINSDDETFVASSKELISTRVNELESHSVKKDISAMSGTHTGYIHPESEIRPTAMAEGYTVNDPEIFSIFLVKMREFKDVAAFNNSSDPNVNYSQVLFNSIQYALQSYFGNIYPSQEGKAKRNELTTRGMLVDSDEEHKPLTISDFKGIAMCAERAAVANNLLWFAGKEPSMIFGKYGIDDDTSDGHAFLVLTNADGKKLIYDPTNPVIILNEHDQLSQMSPFIHPGGEEVLEGGTVSVSKPTYKLIDGKPVEIKQKNLTYKGNFLDKKLEYA